MTRKAKGVGRLVLPLENLGNLYLFKSVVETRNFSVTARTLGLTPSSVSKKIKAIEDQLNVRLLDRTTRLMRPTEIGTKFYERCNEISQLLEQAESELRELERGLSGTLRIAAPTGFAISRLNPVVYSYMRAFPNIAVEVMVSAEIVDLMRDGIDLAIRLGGTMPEGSGLIRKIATNPRVYCASPGYLRKHGTPSVPADLKSHNCIIGRGKYLSDTWRFTVGGQVEEVEVRGRFVSNNINMLLDAAINDVGVAMLPEYFAAPYLNSGRVQEVLSGFKQIDSWVYSIVPQKHHVPLKTRKFLEMLAEQLLSGRPSPR